MTLGTQSSFAWTLTNTGGSSTAPLRVDQNPVAPFAITSNTCASASLAPGASCSLTLAFSPSVSGEYSGTLAVGDGALSAQLFITGTAATPVTVRIAGGGSVRAEGATFCPATRPSEQTTRAPSSLLNCSGGVCSASVGSSTLVLTAESDNGGATFFTGWSTGGCQTNRQCTFELAGPLEVTATFQPRTKNLVFVSSTPAGPSLGGLAAYDAECNRVASLAGVNDAGSNAFIAAMSDSGTSLRQRLGNARGWVRMDGLPFAD